MNKQELKTLGNAIKKVLPEVVKDWNENKLKQFETFFESNYEDFFFKRKTQERTKILSPVINLIFIRKMNEETDGFFDNDENGSDYLYNETKIEGKITLSPGNSWTGNGYFKTPIHILLRLKISEKGFIEDFFSMIADLDNTKGSWTDPTTKSNFSTLKFYNEDSDSLIICNGESILKRKYLDYKMEYSI